MTAAVPPAPPARRSVSWLDLLAVFLVTFAVFTPVLHGQFAPLDDTVMIENNPKMTRPTWDGLVSFWTGPQFRIYMPLALSAWQGVARLTGTADPTSGALALVPVGFKVLSVTTHSLAAAAAVWTLSCITATRWPSVAGGLLFALHPLQVESVAWTTGLKDVLCGLFTVLSVGCYAAHVHRGTTTPWQDVRWWLALAAALAATFSKSTAMVLPASLLAVDFALRRVPIGVRVASLGIFMLPAVGAALIILNAQAGSHVPNVNAALRPFVAADAYAFYLGKVVWPIGLMVDYGRHPVRVLETGALRWTWLVPAVVLAGVAAARSRRLWLATALFVIPVLPLSGLKSFDMQQYSTVTDHYAYQSLLGVGLAAALLLQWRPMVGAAAPAVLAAAACLAWHGSRAWQVPEPQYRRLLTTNPGSWLARDLLIARAVERGDFRAADRLSREVDRLRPDDGVMLDNRAIAGVLRGRYHEAAADEKRAIAHLAVDLAQPSQRLMLIGAQLKDVAIAEAGVREWLKADPGNPFAANVLRSILTGKASPPASGSPVTRPGR